MGLTHSTPKADGRERQQLAAFCCCRVCFEQVHQQEDVRAEIDDGGQVSLEGCLLTIRAIHQQLPAVP